MRKQHLRLIAKLYLASIAQQQDGGFEAETCGLSEDEANFIVKELDILGDKMSKGHPNHYSLIDIVRYVEDMYYE